MGRRKKERKIVACACGCGARVETPAPNGNERRFVNGHNGKKYTGDDATPAAYSRRQRERQRLDRKNNPGNVQRRKRNFLRKLKVRIVKLLGAKCSACGIPYDGANAAIFDCHHREPENKVFSIASDTGNVAWARIETELAKCDLVCSNCHRLHHGGVN